VRDRDAEFTRKQSIVTRKEYHASVRWQLAQLENDLL
jgi:hypothetical protein